MTTGKSSRIGGLDIHATDEEVKLELILGHSVVSAAPFVVQPQLTLNPMLVSGVVEGDAQAIEYTQENGNNGRPSGVLQAWGNGFVAGFLFEYL